MNGVTVERADLTRRGIVAGLAGGMAGLGFGLVRPSEALAADCLCDSFHLTNNGRVDIWPSVSSGTSGVETIGLASRVGGSDEPAIAIGHKAASVGGGAPGGTADGGFAISDYSTGFTDPAQPLIYASRYTGVSTAQPKSSFMGRLTARGAGNVGGGGWSVYGATYADQNGVDEKDVSSISAGGEVFCGSHSFIQGERVSVYGTNNTDFNGVHTITGTSPTSITINKTSSSGAGAGKVRNAPSAFAFGCAINCKLDRSIIQPGATNSDDVGGMSVFSWGPGRGTDAVYISDNPNRGTPQAPKSAWITGFACGADVDFAFTCGAITIGADNSLGSANQPYGAAFDCSKVTLVPGAHAMRLPPGGAITSRAAVGSGTFKHLLSLNASPNFVRLAQDGDNVAVWNGNASPTLANGRVVHLFGTTSNPPEMKVDATTNGSRAQITAQCLDPSGSLVRGELFVEASNPIWPATILKGSHLLSLQVANMEVMRLMGGTGPILIRDGVNFQLETTNGTKIGTNTSQKLGFFGKTPITRPTLPGPATDQSTTQALANAIRTALIDYGLAA